MPGSLVGEELLSNDFFPEARSTINRADAADKQAAESVLGRGHALTRAVSNQHTFALQSVVAALAVAAGELGVLLHVRNATLVLGVGLAVGVAFVLMWVVARKVTRERAQNLIAAGNDSVILPVVARERRRLGARKERERLAKSLETLHRDALRWHEILPNFRPPQGVVQLRNLSEEVKALTDALRHDRVRVQGVALSAWLLTDGYASPLYANELGPLREELNRIRYLLESGDQVAHDETRAEDAAAA